MSGRAVREVAVVIPVHDEEELLEQCLRSVADAADRVARTTGATVRTTVVLDACRDGSAEIAARWPVDVLRIDARSVGVARRVGTAHALARAASPPAELWLAHTDGDSIVPANWLTCQLQHQERGADLVIGTVRPDFADLTPRHVAHWRATHRRGRPPGHVHGANLGLRASTYLAAAGFPEIDEHEDVRLVEKVLSGGATSIACDRCEVVTSGRFVGRTPGGYAGHLRAVAAQLAAEDVA